MIPAGQRNQLITIQSPPSSRDSLGQVTGSWTDVMQVWARVRPARSREFFAAGSMQAVADVVFGINWAAGITADMRVVWNSEPYAIVGPPADVEGGRHTLELMCISGARDAQ